MHKEAGVRQALQTIAGNARTSGRGGILGTKNLGSLRERPPSSAHSASHRAVYRHTAMPPGRQKRVQSFSKVLNLNVFTESRRIGTNRACPEVKQVNCPVIRDPRRHGPAVNNFTDLVALFASVGATYAAVRIWGHAFSYWPLWSRTRPGLQAGRPNTAVPESKHMDTNLSQIAATIKATEQACESLPAESEIEQQIADLEDMCTALSNDSLRLRVNEFVGQLRSDTRAERPKHYQAIMDLLAEEKRKRSADLRLVAHYENTINEYVGSLDQQTARKHTSVERANAPSPDETIATYDESIDFALHHEIPEGVRFLETSKALAPDCCGHPAFDIKFEIHGQPVEPRELDHALGQTILQTIERSIKQRVGSSRCPEHGSAVQIIVSGDSLAQLAWRAPGCCQKLLATVQAKLAPRH